MYRGYPLPHGRGSPAATARSEAIERRTVCEYRPSPFWGEGGPVPYSPQGRVLSRTPPDFGERPRMTGRRHLLAAGSLLVLAASLQTAPATAAGLVLPRRPVRAQGAARAGPRSRAGGAPGRSHRAEETGGPGAQTRQGRQGGGGQGRLRRETRREGGALGRARHGRRRRRPPPPRRPCWMPSPPPCSPRPMPISTE